jgi:hypothetical protein
MKHQLRDTDGDVAADESLRRLEAHVQCRLGGQVRDLQLSLRGGGVVLHGRARTYYAKQLAQHALMGIASVPIAANEIQVT